jgi:membrane-bound metal-dependent hydrolase YbcI (DUF457 family)
VAVFVVGGCLPSCLFVELSNCIEWVNGDLLHRELLHSLLHSFFALLEAGVNGLDRAIDCANVCVCVPLSVCAQARQPCCDTEEVKK